MTLRPALRLIAGEADAREPSPSWGWFCSHCAAPAPSGAAPAPTARVCGECGFGLLLETLRDAIPSRRQAFVVVDSALRIQAVSRAAEALLQITESSVVDSPLEKLLVSAESETTDDRHLEHALHDALAGRDQIEAVQARSPHTFGVRWRVRISRCGPPRAALLVLEALRAVD